MASLTLPEFSPIYRTTMIVRCLTLLLAFGLSSAVFAAEEGSNPAASPSESAAKPEPAKRPLEAEVSIQPDLWQRHYQAGLRAYQNRQYLSAEKHLLAAMRETKQRGGMGQQDLRQIKTRNVLAELYYSEGKYDQAQPLFSTNLTMASKVLGAESKDAAQSLNGLAAIALTEGKFDRAEALSRQSLKIREKLLGADSGEVGQTLHILAVALAKQDWFDEALPLFKKSLEILEKHPGPDSLNLADGLRDMAIFYQVQGKKEESAKLFTRALAIKEKVIRLDMPPAISGVISFPWDQGSPGSGQIVDGEYPLKYMTAGGLRVAATVIQSMNILDVLISLKNTSGEPIDVGLGPVNMTVVRPRVKQLERMNPDRIDWVLEENTVWDWTHRQPSLAQLQQNTLDPGKVALRAPACIECPGGNVWGRYGRWEYVGSLPTHSNAKARALSQIESILLSGEVKWDTVRALDLNIVHIGAGESRSGLVYFYNPHVGETVLKIFVGNTSFDIPFHLAL